MADFHPLRSLKEEKEEDAEWDALNQLATQLAASRPTAPMPSMEHLTYRDYEHVYEPSHDTYLLIDALQYELEQLLLLRKRQAADADSTQKQQQQQQPAVVTCLEIGCGSGVASVFFRTQWLQTMVPAGFPPLLSYVTDINPRALQVTQQSFQHAATAKQQHDHHNDPALMMMTAGAVQAVRCDLASALLPGLQHQVTFVLFNPPYVPTPDDEVGNSHGIEASWAGGCRGRRVVDRALPQLALLLEHSPAAAAYLVTVDENHPAQLAQQLAELHLCMRPLFRRRTKNEFLTIQKITWMSKKATEQEEDGTNETQEKNNA